jgi:two-component system OmpR family response regulator
MPNPAQILIVDDDEGITSLMADYLSRFGFLTHIAGDGVAMRVQLVAHLIDLVVLDLMLPGDDGLTLVREVREVRERSLLPVIMLTARSNPYDRVLVLESGADDYLSKPFEPRDLVARIQTVLRRAIQQNEGASQYSRSDVIHFDGWTLHRDDRCLTSRTGLVVALSNAEYRLLATFLQTSRQLFSRDQLMEQARGGPWKCLSAALTCWCRACATSWPTTLANPK